MNTDLHKRLEEAAEKAQKKVTPNQDWGDIYHGFKKGAEYGYKEAIAEMTEWIETHGGISDNGDWHSIRLTELQAHMYKLWEGEKWN